MSKLSPFSNIMNRGSLAQGGVSAYPLLAASALGLMVSLLIVATAWAQGTGVLEGQVVSGTAGGPEASGGIPVSLRVYQGEAELEVLETMTEADGHFRFENLDTDASLEYWPEALYQGVSYTTDDPIRFGGEQISPAATITIYETTDDDSMIKVDSVHVIVESFGEVLRVSEIQLFGNTGDRAFVGSESNEGPATTVFIPLPAEAVGLAFGDEGEEARFVQVSGGLRDTEPVPPGTETSLAFFSYHLVVTGATVPLERSFAYPVADLNILVAQPGLALNSDQLELSGSEFFQGRQYDLYVAGNLGPETPLVLEFVPVAEAADGSSGVAGMPSSSGQGVTGGNVRGNQQLFLWIGVGLGALAVLGAVFYPLATRRAAPAPVSGPDLVADSRARPLLNELANLEEVLEAGEINEVAYEQRRAELSEELKSL
jgi:hypothetical protein